MSDTSPPPLEYPALFTWRVIGQGGDALKTHARRSVEAVLGPVADDAITERDSRAGNYRAVHVTCLLQSEEQRQDIYSRLRASPLVVLVL